MCNPTYAYAGIAHFFIFLKIIKPISVFMCLITRSRKKGLQKKQSGGYENGKTGTVNERIKLREGNGSSHGGAQQSGAGH